MKTKKNGGFTLVEILIVVVILGILAAIVIPQFTQASTEARESSLASNLQTIRSQIELYKIQHSDNWPDTTDLASFTADMCTQGADGFGPYLQQIPVNPFATGDVSLSVGAGMGTTATTSHWRINTTDNTFHAHDSDDHYNNF
ncbi:MAG: redox-sensing transcriptional repressor Rex [Candidatus Aenigmatarchaeota archaeon]|nr:MAG: redox-sensing transcriptional repressor Rex [Candidatus Aenigmarchaeota archaeon]